jgi:hypothetical protein
MRCVARILVATREGLHALVRGSIEPHGFAGRDVTFLAADDGEVWAIVEGSELWHAAGADWTHVADMPGTRATCIAVTDDAVFVGSSEAGLFRVDGARLEPVASFDEAEGRGGWYTPWGGPPDTRSMAEWDEAVYVNVHVGGILRTEDRGATWRPTTDIDADVHQVTTAEGMVLAACAGGLAKSEDRGSTWTIRSDGLEAPYARAVTICGDTAFMSASNGPRGGRSAVYRSGLAGGVFERCRDGLPEWFDDNVDSHCLDAMPDRDLVAFGTSDGRVFVSEDRGSTWTTAASGLPPINRVLVLP